MTATGIKKLYYTIGEVSKMLKINTSNITHFERILGPLNSSVGVKAVRGNQCLPKKEYTELDIQRIRTILKLSERFHLQAIREELRRIDFPLPK